MVKKKSEAPSLDELDGFGSPVPEDIPQDDWESPQTVGDIPQDVEDGPETVEDDPVGAEDTADDGTPDGPDPAPEHGDDGMNELRAAVAEVLRVPRNKNSLPVISMFTGEAGFKRYFLLDVDSDAYMRAWDMYYEHVGRYDPDGFLLMVYDIIQSGLPRLYRAVVWAPLERRE